MESQSSPDPFPRVIAFLHDTSLPHPLGILSTALVEYITKTSVNPGLPAHYSLTPIDLAHYDLSQPSTPSFHDATPPSPSISSPSNLSASPKKTTTDIISILRTHSAFLALIPYHTWSYTQSFKSFLSTSSYLDLVRRKSILLIGLGKEVPYHHADPGRTWKRPCYPMLEAFLGSDVGGLGMKVVTVDVEMWHVIPAPPRPEVVDTMTREGKRTSDKEVARQRRFEAEGGAVEDTEGGIEQKVEIRKTRMFPEFEIYGDYWDYIWVLATKAGEGQAWIGGQQAEAWERRGYDRMLAGMKKIYEILDDSQAT